MSDSELRQRIENLESEIAALKKDRDKAQADRAKISRNLSQTHDYLLELLSRIDQSKINLNEDYEN